MPIEWQKRFVCCLEQLEETFDWRPEHGRYWVQMKDDDPLMQHRRPDIEHLAAIRRTPQSKEKQKL